MSDQCRYGHAFIGSIIILTRYTVLYTIGAAAIALSAGFYTGSKTKPSKLGTSPESKTVIQETKSQSSALGHSSDDSDSESDTSSTEGDGDLAGLIVGPLDECKMV